MLYRFFTILIVCICWSACKVQQHSQQLNLKEKDLYAFKFDQSDIQSFTDPNVEEHRAAFYQEEQLLIFERDWNNGFYYQTKIFYFVQGSDTMSIECNCAQFENLYFEKVPFQKGQFTLNPTKALRSLQETDAQAAKELDLGLGKLNKQKFYRLNVEDSDVIWEMLD